MPFVNSTFVELNAQKATFEIKIHLSLLLMTYHAKSERVLNTKPHHMVLQHTIGKLSMKATTLLQTSSQLEVCTQN
jgi:hypothetical protein